MVDLAAILCDISLHSRNLLCAFIIATFNRLSYPPRDEASTTIVRILAPVVKPAGLLDLFCSNSSGAGQWGSDLERRINVGLRE
jgi:hypothetical protein